MHCAQRVRFGSSFGFPLADKEVYAAAAVSFNAI